MKYEWYEVVENDEIQQGDIIHSCPILVPPATFSEIIETKVEEYE